MNRGVVLGALLIFLAGFANRSAAAESPSQDFVDRPTYVPHPPDEPEILPRKTSPANPIAEALSGPITPSATQPKGALSGRIVYMTGGHGWTYGSGWSLQRPNGLNEMNEDYGNLDQLNMFATYCFNAGAVVVPFRPIGYQTNEVVLDNDSASVSFAGTWNNSASTSYYYGSAGAIPYRYASLIGPETATATYTPAIPKTGFYPVYSWVRHGPDRGDQLYRIRHTGGEAQVRIPHYMVGNGWIYLGEYYFNSGSNPASGAVVISNLRSTTNGSAVIADAIRFGNGMGSIDRGTGVSTYPREEENTRYWVQAGLGYGMPASLYDAGSSDYNDSITTPPLMAAEMNRENTNNPSDPFKRVYINFHSNANDGSARGVTGLINTTPTPNQARLAAICSAQVNSELLSLTVPPLELVWGARGSTYTSGYGEISNNSLHNEMDATIIEVAFHDNVSDAKLMRDSKARSAVARAALHGIIKFFNEFDSLATNFFPEPPINPRAIGGASGISIAWGSPVAQANSGAPTNYVVYVSTNGYGFGNPISAGNVASITLTNLLIDQEYYFRVSAANAGGESLPSEVVGCRRSSNASAAKILVVNAFDRFDRTTNLRQSLGVQAWKPPGPVGTNERVLPRQVNSFDYVVQHGNSIHAYGMPFDSCQNEAVANGQVVLTNYFALIWAAGTESTADETFSAIEQTKVTSFLNGGGHLFVSGSEIGWDLDRSSGPTAADRAFYNNNLHARLNGDSNDDSNIYANSPALGSIFAGNTSIIFDDGTKGIYWVQTPDIITPNGAGTRAALYYNGTINPAAIQYDGSVGGGKVVYFGFPFETITLGTTRNAYLADILNFFHAPTLLTNPLSQIANQGTNVTFNVVATGTAPLSFQWRFGASNLSGETNASLIVSNVQSSNAGNYLVMITNFAGSITSSIALLTVNLRPVISAQPTNLVVSQGSNAMFNVTAAGTAPLAYQWLFNGDDIIGATSPNYVRTNAQVLDAGNYSVRISNMVASVFSSNAVLTITVATTFSSASISSNQIQLVLTGQPGRNVSIQSSSNLVDWVEITNAVLTNGVFEFSDMLTNDQRFYRTVEP
ncbi:MAG: immunoglobulin domain-containing protein [Verrucomicrobiota bacterium]